MRNIPKNGISENCGEFRNGSLFVVRLPNLSSIDGNEGLTTHLARVHQVDNMSHTLFLPRVFATHAGNNILSSQTHQLRDRRRYNIFRRIQRYALNDDRICG